MKQLRELILEQVASGRLPKAEAARMLADILRAQSGPRPAGTTDIAIVGMACRFPPRSDLDGFWADLAAGADLITDFPASRRKDIDALVEQLAARSPDLAAGLARAYYEAAFLEQVDQFDYTVFKVAPGEARLIDPQQRILLEVTLECLENAGYTRERLNGSRTGVYMAYAEADYERLVLPDEPSAIHAALPAMLAGRISYLFNLSGPSQVIETTCSSSLVAVHNACQAIIVGDCELALAGGIRLMLFPFAEGFSSTPQLGISSPDGRTHAFDEAGEGTGSGEGAGVLLLKPLARAIQDRDHIYAVIKGSAVNSDGKSTGVTAPNPEAQAGVIVAAWKRAGVDPETISYIEAHGTGTRLGDPIEIEGLTSAFRQYTDRKAFCAIGSVKTNLGHLSGAAGIAGLIKTVLALKKRQLPPSLHFNRPNPLIDFANAPVFVNHELRPWDSPDSPRRAGVSSFGITGTNCHLIVEEYTGPDGAGAEPAPASRAEVLTLSAPSREGLARLLEKYDRFLSSAEAGAYSLEQICYSANTGRDTYAHRLAIIAHDSDDLLEQIKRAARLYAHESPGRLLGDTICAGVVERQEELAAPSAAAPEPQTPAAELAALFVRTPRIAWDTYYAGRAIARTPLPTYVFERKRCWVALEESQQAVGAQLRIDQQLAARHLPLRQNTQPVAPTARADKAGWLYTLRWREAPRAADRAERGLPRGTWLILADELGIGRALADRLTAAGCEPVLVQPGARFTRVGDRRYQLAPAAQADWHQLLGDLHERRLAPLAGVAHLWTCRDPDQSPRTAEQYLERQTAGVFSLFALLKQLAEFQDRQPLDMWIVSNYAAVVTAEDPFLFPETAPLWGLAKVVPQECYWAQCYCLDIATDGQAPGDLADTILAEISQPAAGRDHVLAYRQQARFIQQIERLDLTRAADRAQPVVKDGGVYLLAGGAGRIGLGIGLYFAGQAQVTLILVNRSALPPKAEWQGISAGGGADDTVMRRLAGIEAIEQLGSRVEYVAADIGDGQVMARVVETVVARYGRIDGVINATMDVQRKKLSELSQGDFEYAVLNRIRGAVVLDQVTRPARLDFFIICSSMTSIFGGRTEADDAAANLFLDTYGLLMHQDGRDVTVLNLPGIQRRPTAPATHAELVLPSIGADDLAELVDRLIKKSIPFVFIADFDLKRIRALLPALRVRFAPALLDEQPSLPPAGAKRLDTAAQTRARLKDKHRQADYTETELRLADVWLNVLGYDQIAIDDNFFDLGGDSLMAMRVIEGVRESLGIDLEIVEIYTNPTISALAGQIALRADPGAASKPPATQAGATEAPEDGQPALRPLGRDQYLPLSFAQQRLWLLEQIDPGNPANNISSALKIAGRLDSRIFVQSLHAIIERHAILRTTFAVAEDQPVQHVAPLPLLQPALVDLRGMATPDQMAEIYRLAIADARQPFDLASGPLLRATLIALGDDEHVVVLTVHHIVFDGWSMGIFIQELAAFYTAFAAGRPVPLPPLPIQYADFAHWQRQRLQGQALDQLIDYWRARLGDAPVLELPTDYQRPAMLTFEGDNQALNLPPELAKVLKDLSQHEHVTLFTTLLAAFLALLRLYTGQDDLVIGAFSAHRDRPETQKLIGLFANILVLRVDLAGHPTFRELLARVREVVLEASAYQALTYEQILEATQPKRSTGRLPLVQVVLDFFVDPMQAVQFKDLTITPMAIDRGTARYDLILEVIDAGAGGLAGNFEYNTSLFKPATIARMAKQLETFLRRIVAQPDIRI